MPDSRIFEGKTTNEAIEKGLKELKVSKNDVEIKVIKDEDKRSFFDILAPRVVKVELMLKEKKQERKKEKWKNWGLKPLCWALAVCGFPCWKTGRSMSQRPRECWIRRSLRV